MQGENRCEDTLSPASKPRGAVSGLEAELKGLKLRGTIWGWPGASEEKALPEPGVKVSLEATPRLQTQFSPE